MPARNVAAAPIIITLAAILLLAAYFGAYYGMLRREVMNIGDVIPGTGRYELEPVYRLDSVAVSTFFWPAHRVDRAIFPARWSAEIMVD